jgi:hypothetical protein
MYLISHLVSEMQDWDWRDNSVWSQELFVILLSGLFWRQSDQGLVLTTHPHLVCTAGVVFK